MMLLIAEIKPGLRLPDFGPEHRAHIENKRHDGHRCASISAWRLLEAGMKHMGCDELPEVVFEEGGKPVFRNAGMHFSISHSGNLAAVLISDENCAVDIECCERRLEERLIRRCMHENEIAAGMDFFECWTKKECLGKLSGKGMPSRPCEIDLTAKATEFSDRCVHDAQAKKYRLCAAGTGSGSIEPIWVEL